MSQATGAHKNVTALIAVLLLLIAGCVNIVFSQTSNMFNSLVALGFNEENLFLTNTSASATVNVDYLPSRLVWPRNLGLSAATTASGQFFSSKKFTKVELDTVALALTTDNELYCWGASLQYCPTSVSVRTPSPTNVWSPRLLNGAGSLLASKTIVDFKVRRNSYLILTNDGKIYTMGGSNAPEVFGTSTTPLEFNEANVKTDSSIFGKVITAVAMSSGATTGTSCFITSDFTVHCVGDNSNLILGTVESVGGTVSSKSVQVNLDAMTATSAKPQEMCMGSNHAIIMGSDRNGS